jgi:adenylosuccinate lyase
MEAVTSGGDRQLLHERIRLHSHAVTAALKAGADRNDLLDRLEADPAFQGIDFRSLRDQAQFVGRAPEQVAEFLAEHIEPLRQRHPDLLAQSAQIAV